MENNKNKESKKKFEKKFMHPTRRKLADMVLNNKEYDKNSVISMNKSSADKTDREIGDTWEDEKGNLWTQKDGYRIKKSKNTDTLSSVRKSLEYNCKGDCDKKKYGYTDLLLIKETGYCSNCLAEMETPIRINGDWESYAKLRITTKLYKEGVQFLDNLNQAYDEVEQITEIIDADGKIQKWEMDKSPDELRAEIQKDIEITKEKLNEIIESRNEYILKLKDKDYKLVNELIQTI